MTQKSTNLDKNEINEVILLVDNLKIKVACCLRRDQTNH